MSAQLYGDSKVGMIQDSDGFTYIRSNQNSNADILDTLFDDEFFHFESNDTSQWFVVYKLFSKKGYVHKSRILDLNKLDRSSQMLIIDSVFKKERLVYGKSKIHNNHYDRFYAPTMNMFITYINNGFDEKRLKVFFDLLVYESGSASELPAWTLGYIYLKHPKKLLSLVEKYDHKVIYSDLGFGWYNVSYEQQDEIENYTELNQMIRDMDSK